MASCHDMKLGEVYVCQECGIELKVIKECKDCGQPSESCDCPDHCSFECCGKPMQLKKQ